MVEDEPIIRMCAVELLEQAGFEVLEAESADAAVRTLELRHDVRILFADIEMPGSMNGLRLAAAVRGRWPPIEIVLTSGRRVTPGEMPEGSVFIPKPYAIPGLVATLRRLAAG
jgi:CheY-like chemotaxis protein